MKPCVKCGGADRYPSGKCKACVRAYDLQRHEKDREKFRLEAKAYREKHPHKARASVSKWHKNNPEAVNANNKLWRKKNPGKVKSSLSAWQKANPGRCNAHNAKRKATKLLATPAWANEFIIEEIYDLAARRTKATGFKWQVDHIVPLQSKLVCGLHWECNMQVIPAVENQAKGNLFWPDMP